MNPLRPMLPPVSTSSPLITDHRPRPSRKTLYFNEFNPRSIGTLIASLKTAGLPAGTKVVFGHYGFTKKYAEQVMELAKPPTSLKVTFAPIATVPKILKAHPELDVDRSKLSDSQLEALGRDIGTAFRRDLEAHRRAGEPYGSFQLDEIVPSASKDTGARLRRFLQGVIDGAANGKPGEHFPHEPFIVHVAQLEGLMKNASPHFLDVLNHNTTHVMQETYPPFRPGHDLVAAKGYADVRTHMLEEGGVQAELAKKTSLEISPGFAPGWGGVFERNAERSRAATPALQGFAAFGKTSHAKAELQSADLNHDGKVEHWEFGRYAQKHRGTALGAAAAAIARFGRTHKDLALNPHAIKQSLYDRTRLTEAQANEWRRRFLVASRAAGVDGYSVFDLADAGNATESVIRSVVRQLAAELERP